MMDPLGTRNDTGQSAQLDPSLASAFKQMKNSIEDEATFSAVYKFLLSHTQDPVWICDESGATLFINEHFTDLTGFAPEDMVNKPSIDFFETKYHRTIREERRRRDKGLISTYEIQFKTKFGHFIPIKLNAYPLPNGSTLGILIDLSGHTMTENIHQFVVEKMDQGIWVVDADDVCIYANPALCQMLGYTIDEMHTKTSNDIVATKYQRQIRQELERRARGQVSQYEICLIASTGDEIPVRIWASPLPDGGSMGIVTDLRNEKREELAYKHLIDNMNEAVWLRSREGILEFANEHFCELLGYEPEELIGDTHYFYWADDSKEKVKAEQEKRKDGLSAVYRAEMITKNGVMIPVLVSSTPTIDGGSFGIITDLRDILAKENVYQNLVEHMNEAVWFGDADEHTVYVNPKFCEITGYSYEECLQRESYDYLDELSAELVRKQNLLRERGQASKYEANLKVKGGGTIPVLVSGTPTYDGGTIGILTDLRELKAKEQELAKQDHYLATVMENSADGIVSVDVDNIITSWNKGAEKIFGFTKEEAVGQSIFIHVPKERKDAGELDHISKEVARRGFVKDFRTQRMHKDGHLIDISLTESPLQDDAGNYMGYSTIYRDISLQKKWEEELNLRFENLKNAYIELGKKGRHMDYFVDLLDGVVGDYEINNIADFIIGATAMITKVDACTLRVYDPKKNALILEATNGVTAEWYNKGDEPLRGGITEKAFHMKKPLKVLDLNQEPLYKGQKLALKHGLTSLLVIPLYVKDEFLGSLKLYISKESKFELLDNDFIENFAKIASIALKLRKPRD